MTGDVAGLMACDQASGIEGLLACGTDVRGMADGTLAVCWLNVAVIWWLRQGKG